MVCRRALGPDGKQFALSGEVELLPLQYQAILKPRPQKAKQIRAEALAPTNPSAHDPDPAAAAPSFEAQAQQELKKEERDASTIDKETLNLS